MILKIVIWLGFRKFLWIFVKLLRGCIEKLVLMNDDLNVVVFIVKFIIDLV